SYSLSCHFLYSFFLMIRRPATFTLFPYTTLFRSIVAGPGSLEPKLNTHLLLGDAIYTAPETVNEATTVEIQVEVESKNGYISDPSAPNGRRKLGKMILLTTIRLVPENFVQLTLNGADQELPQLAD